MLSPSVTSWPFHTFPLNMPQPSQLSQFFSKASGTRAHCKAIRKLHRNDGTVHSHGPRKNPCPGPHKTPLCAGSGTPSLTSISSDNSTSTQSGSSRTSTYDAAHRNTTVHSILGLSSDPITLQPTVPPSSTCHPPLGVRTIKHIPKPVRPILASTLADTLDKTVSKLNDGNEWTDLFNFGAKYLRLPDTGGKRRNLSSILIRRFKGGSKDSEGPQSTPPSFRKNSPEATKAAVVSSKLEDCNISTAVRNRCSDDTPVVFSSDNLEQLKQAPTGT